MRLKLDVRKAWTHFLCICEMINIMSDYTAIVLQYVYFSTQLRSTCYIHVSSVMCTCYVQIQNIIILLTQILTLASVGMTSLCWRATSSGSIVSLIWEPIDWEMSLEYVREE